MESMADRLLNARKLMGLTQAVLSKKIGINQSLYSKYETGSLEMPDIIKSKLFDFGINLTWLITGTGKMFETPNHLMSAIEDQAQTIVDLKRSESVRIPVVGCIAAGPPLEIFDVDPLDYITLDKTLIRYPNEYVAFQVEGDSMYPEIRNGDVVLIHRKYDYGYLHETIVAVQINGENTLKTIHVDDLHRQSILYPINSRKHKAIILNEDTSDNVTILGQLVMLFRKYL